MLTSLHIENIAVIKCVDLDLRGGFTVLTGQTGAGKSIVIDAIGLLLGGKLQKDLIRAGQTQAMVSGVFTSLPPHTSRALDALGVAADEEGMLLIQRTVGTDGRSSVRLNGRAVPLSLLRQVGGLLIDIHGQHDNQKLLDPASHLQVLDEYAGNAQRLAEYRLAYDALCAVKREIASLSKSEQEKERTVELLTYQLADIDAIAPKAGEDEALEERRRRIRDGEKIRKNAGLVSRALYRNEKGMSASEMIAKAASAMQTLAPYLPGAQEYARRLTEYRYEIADMGQAAAELLDENGDGERELDEIEARLHELSKLKRKYGSDIAEVLAYREKVEKELRSIKGAKERLTELKLEYKQASEKAKALADGLSEIRRTRAAQLEQRVLEELKYLEMPKVRFHISIAPTEEGGRPLFRADGCDRVEFLISANPGEPLKPLDRIASGGELSRVMLALKSANAGDIEIGGGAEIGTRNGTMIFDEIDTGISGKTSQRIGLRLRALGCDAQVLCITHSAQIAAVAHTQLLISKQENEGRVETSVTELDRDGRIKELARIMGGAQMTETLLKSASELLCEYNPPN